MKRYNIARRIEYAILVIACLGCDAARAPTSATVWSRDAEMVSITNVYMSWANAVRNHNLALALTYCIPNSNCEGATRSAKESWDEGNELYYNLAQVAVWHPAYLDKSDTEVDVRGNMGLYQGPREPEYVLGFLSNVTRVNGKWRIDGINATMAPNWW